MNKELQSRDIVRLKKDNSLCYITNREAIGTFNQYITYNFVDITGVYNSVHFNRHEQENPFELVARYFEHKDLKHYDKIFVWKSNRWFAEFVSSLDDKYVYTIGHGRVPFKDVVPYTDNWNLSTNRNAALKYHQYKYSEDFLKHIYEILETYKIPQENLKTTQTSNLSANKKNKISAKTLNL